MAEKNDKEFAAWKAGYPHPIAASNRLMKNPAIQQATFVEVQRFLKDKGAAIGVYTLAELAIDEKIPAGVRRAAAADLAKLSGVGVDGETGDKEPHEMTADELARHSQKLERQLQAIERARADAAKPVITQEDNPKNDLFD